ncbi:PIG-L deacetylase family protein [Acetobacter estunensis]|uniref:PIG-L deacetylase family protein n=1 Tax=Acetobacter estunensis TaxID=104097 RepID=UPI001C2D62C7|nr:PIG-L deacetylase family protein [Acetobacter estunensis]MBV1837625.1 PIG-L family deacetylase [Acetobacter estunensis]
MKAGEAQALFRSLPFRSLDEIAPGNALILAPHADDESLGCGGLIAHLCAAGRPPLVVIATDGVGSHPNSQAWPPTRLRAQREREAREATAALGLSPDRLVFLGLPDTAAPHEGKDFNRVVWQLVQLVHIYRCGTVFVPWRHDPHCDHEAVWKMGVALSRESTVSLFSYPVWGWMIPPHLELGDEKIQGVRLDISAFAAHKKRAIRLHASQYGDLIDDDPEAFRLPEQLLEIFDAPYEVFLCS